MKNLSFIAIIAATICLSACGKKEEFAGQYVEENIKHANQAIMKASVDGHDVELHCLGGVRYWSGYYRMAPYINPETLTFERCN